MILVLPLGTYRRGALRPALLLAASSYFRLARVGLELGMDYDGWPTLRLRLLFWTLTVQFLSRRPAVQLRLPLAALLATIIAAVSCAAPPPPRPDPSRDVVDCKAHPSACPPLPDPPPTCSYAPRPPPSTCRRVWFCAGTAARPLSGEWVCIPRWET